MTDLPVRQRAGGRRPTEAAQRASEGDSEGKWRTSRAAASAMRNLRAHSCSGLCSEDETIAPATSRCPWP